MTRIRRSALLAAVAAGSVFIASCADHHPPTTHVVQSQPSISETVPSQVPMESVDAFPDVNMSTVSLDDVRKAELSRRARRPDGDPERLHARNYAEVLKGPKPKPAEVMPATTCRSVEPVPKDTDPFSGLNHLHSSTVVSFEIESGFGFGRVIRLSSSKNADRFELVSLLTDLQPSVYVLEQMATPPLARQAKRRPLDEFETRGLDAVRKGEELVWTREAPKRMFGSIRASKSCLDCHAKAKEGDLLGAFTYYLEVPVDELNQKK